MAVQRKNQVFPWHAVDEIQDKKSRSSLVTILKNILLSEDNVDSLRIQRAFLAESVYVVIIRLGNLGNRFKIPI